MGLSQRVIQLLAADPDDVERRKVVADQLIERGDLRGELMALQLKLREVGEATPHGKPLAREIDRFLKLHAKHFTGALWTQTSVSHLQWELGFIDSATLWSSDAALPRARRGRAVPPPRPNKLLKLTTTLLGLESSLLLRQLSLGTTYQSLLHLWDTLETVAMTAPRSLRVLEIRELDGRVMPEYEPYQSLDITHRGNPLQLRSDTLPLEAVAELFG